MDEKEALKQCIELMELADTAKGNAWQQGWELYYPIGAHDPDHTVLRLCPGTAKHYHRMDSGHFNLSGRT